MMYVLFILIPTAIALAIPQIFGLIVLFPVYLVLRSIQLTMQFFGGKDYGRKN